MTTVLPTEGFTPAEITGRALRQDFVSQFLIEEGLNYADFSMEELIEKYEVELGEAKRRHRSINADAEWAEMDQWLSERGYVEPQYREN